MRWAFFDVGNVLFNDDPQAFVAYERVFAAVRERRPGYAFDAMLAERERLATEVGVWALHRIARQALSREEAMALLLDIRRWLEPRYDEHHLPNEQLFETLAALRPRHRLGVIANQPAECRASLARRGLLEWFEVVAISEELRMSKPAPELFEWALSQAGVEPEDAVMIGDRHDNDVAPAQGLGMRTIRVDWPSSAAKNWRPTDPMARAFLASCDRQPLFPPAPALAAGPDERVESLAGIPSAIERIWEAGPLGKHGV